MAMNRIFGGAYTNGEMRLLGDDVWEATNVDPQMLIQRGRLGPRYAVVEIEALDRPLDAAVYLRTAGVFSEDRRVDFPESRRLLIVIDLAEGPAAEGVRLDPAEHSGTRFRLRLFRRRHAGLARLLRQRLARQPGLAVNLIGPDLGLGRRVGRPRLPSIGRPGLAETLERIWELAAFEAGRDPLPPPHCVEISFLVPVYNADPAWLDALYRSLRDQAAGAELILADDGSTDAATAFWLASHDGAPGLTILRSPVNRGIAHATNRALAVAQGRWVGLVDHDDALEPHAVDRIRRAIRDRPDAQFLFTDEVIGDAEMKPISGFWKPGFDPVLLSGVNYVNHLSLYRRARLEAMGGLCRGFDGSQDYEMVLRYTRGLAAEEIVHIPYPAYRWRQRAESVSHADRAPATARARTALETHMVPGAGTVRVEPALLPDLHRVRFVSAPTPMVSVIIPNRDSYDLISRLLEDLAERTDYPSFEVIIVDNGSTDPRVPALYRTMEERLELQYDIAPAPFNFANMVNQGVARSRGEVLLLLNNDISVIEPGWLGEMVECLAYPGTGIVGARLLYPNRSVQHAGVVLGLGGLAGHWYYKATEDDRGEMGRLAVRNGMTAVTGACLLVSRVCWVDLGGMDAERFAVAYNDVDFCVRARQAGYGVVWTPFATLFHHESASRGSDLVGEKARRFQREKEALDACHATATFLDPCLSPWYSRYQSRPRLLVGEHLPAPRSFHGFSIGGVAPTVAHPSDDRQPMPKSVQG
ncbi:MAG: glycosyltransferase family 2 protein [Pseudomonadota bacterium]